MIAVRRRHTAGRGREVILTMSDDVYDALAAAVQVAFDDPETTPAEYADAAEELWRAMVSEAAPADADRPPGTSGSWGER